MSKNKNIRVDFDSPNKANKPFNEIDFIKLKSNEAILVFLKDGTMNVIANVNRLGGVCDDCAADFMDEIVVSWQVVTFKE